MRSEKMTVDELSLIEDALHRLWLAMPPSRERDEVLRVRQKALAHRGERLFVTGAVVTRQGEK